MDESIKTQLIKKTAAEGTKAVLKQGAEILGAQHVAKVAAREGAKYAATVASQKGAEAGVSVATAQAAARYATNVAASKATAETLAKSAGAAAGIVIAPIAEVITLARDGQEHSGAEYTEAGMRGVVSGAAGTLATVAAGAAAGSVVPGAGTVVGAVAGLAASLQVNSWLKENSALQSAADEVVEVVEGIADLASDAADAFNDGLENVLEVGEELLTAAWKSVRWAVGF